MILTTQFQIAAQEALAGLDGAFAKVRPDVLTPLSSNGLAHDHIRIGTTGWLLRIPRGNQLGLSDQDYLTLQYECFTTAARSGHVPQIAGILQTSSELPHGAMVVEEIKGRKATRPEDAKYIAKAMARLHGIDIPSGDTMLQKADTPFTSQAFLLNEIFGDAPDRGQIHPETKTMLKTEQQRMNEWFERARTQFADVPLRLIGGDSHPANFLITATNHACLVDVEFATYDMPYIDLADASLPLTQRLDPDVRTWGSECRNQFYQVWKKAVDPALAEKADAGRLIAERAVKLRTLLWLADWTTKDPAAQTRITPLARHNWDRMAANYLDPTVMRRTIYNDIYPALPAIAASSPFRRTP
jgi:thiamine kinase-like enzyme